MPRTAHLSWRLRCHRPETWDPHSGSPPVLRRAPFWMIGMRCARPWSPSSQWGLPPHCILPFKRLRLHSPGANRLSRNATKSRVNGEIDSDPCSIAHGMSSDRSLCCEAAERNIGAPSRKPGAPASCWPKRKRWGHGTCLPSNSPCCIDGQSTSLTHTASATRCSSIPAQT
jgi:hypothetical protein